MSLPTTRAEAKRKGISRYCTGKPCKNGHLCNRKTNSSHCEMCDLTWSRSFADKPLTLERKKKRCITHAKSRAKKSGIDFNICVEDLEWPTHCPVLGIELDYLTAKKLQSNAVTLDRVDNSKGYIKGNVRVISWRANTLKSDATVEELKAVLDYLKNPAKYVGYGTSETKKMTFYALKHSAKRRNIPFNLPNAPLKYPELCPVLGIPLIEGDPKKQNNPSVDRINNTGGYVEGNINVISSRANSLKSNTNEDELVKVLKYMTNYQTITFDK